MEFRVALLVAFLLWTGAAGRGSASPTWIRKMWDQVTGASSQSEEMGTSPVVESISLQWGIPDTGGTVGHVFRYQIPNAAFSGKVEEYKVTEAGYAELPAWLYFNSSSNTFLGVAGPLDLGATAIEVTACASNKSSVSTHFIIQIHAARPAFVTGSRDNGLISHSRYQPDGNKKTMDQSSVDQCQWDQNVYRAILLLDTALDKLSAIRRVKLLYKSAQFLSQSVHSMYIGPKKSDSISRLMDTTTISAGAGDTGNNKTDIGVELSWIVGCNSFSGAGDLSKVLQHNILVGRIRKELGYKVIGWFITETLPPEPLRKLSRQKRQIRATPVQTPTLPSSAPSLVTNMATFSVVETSEVSESFQTIPLSTPVLESTISLIEMSSSMIEASPQSSEIVSSPVASVYETQFSTEIFPTPIFSGDETQFSTDATSLEMSSQETVFPTSVVATEIPESESVSPSTFPDFSLFPSQSMESTQSYFSESASELPEESSLLLSPSEISILPSEASTRFLPEETDIESIEPSLDISESVLPSQTVFPTATLFESDFASSTVMQTADNTEMTSSESDFESSTTMQTVDNSEITSSESDFESSTTMQTADNSEITSSESDFESSTTMQTADNSEITSSESDFESSTTMQTVDSSEITSSIEILPTPASTVNQLMTSVETELDSSSDFISSSIDEEMSSSPLIEVDPSDIMSSRQLELSSSESVPMETTFIMSISDTVLDTASFVVPSLLSSSSIIESSLPVTVVIPQSSTLDMETELQTQMETILPSVEPSFESKQPEQTITSTPIMSPSSVVESMEETLGVSDTQGQFSSDSIAESLSPSISIAESLSPSVSLSLPAEISSSSVFIIPSLSSSEIIDEPTATETETSLLLSSEPSLASETSISSSIMPSSSSPSPVKSSPTSSIVNLVTITPSSGQTLNIVQFPTTLFPEDSSSSPSSTSATSLVIPATTTIAFPETLITLNPESSSTNIFTSPSSSIELVLSTSTVLLLPSSVVLSTVLPSSYETSVPVPSPTSPFVSTEFPPFTTLLPSFTSMVTSPSSDPSVSSTSTVSLPVSTSVTTSLTPIITVTPTNTPPRLVHRIDQIDTQLGVYFEYPVPADSFYDQQDGNTRALQLTLLTLTRQPLGPDSWVQFNPISQTIFGIPLEKDLPRSEADREFVLVAEDSKGLQAQEALKIVIDESSVLNLTHQFMVTVDKDYSSFVTMTTNIIHLITTVANFLGEDKPTNMTVTNVTRGSVEVHWSNNTLSKTVCENETIQRLYEELSGGGKINPDFRRATFPRYNVLDVNVRYQGACVVTPVEPTPVPPVEPPILSSTDSSIYYKTIVPAVVLALLLLLAVLICICLQRRRRLAGRLLLDDEKPIFAKDRHPVLLESELEMRDIHRKPHRPMVLSDDSAYANPAFVLPAARRPLTGATRQAPARPPPYRIPDHFSAFFDDDIDGASVSPPPDYASDAAGVYSRPPPAYRLPPPYASRPASSEA